MNHRNSQRYLASGRSRSARPMSQLTRPAPAELIRKAAPGAAILFTLNHLARETGVPYHYLRNVTERGGLNSNTFYRVFP